jgi:hypothetical protein
LQKEKMKNDTERDNERSYCQSDAQCLMSPGNNRSVFELTESGASKVLFDNVQFHLDGLFSLKSTPLRVQCACKLIEICTSSKQVLCTFRNNGIAATLLRVVGLLSSELDPLFRLCLLALALILCQSDKGNILEGFDMPRNVFASLFSSILQQPSQPPFATNIISESVSDSTVILSNQQSVISSKFSRKRKFGIKKGTTGELESLGNSPLKNIINGNERSKQGAEISCVGKVSCIGNSYVIVRQLQELWPSFFVFCGFPQSSLNDVEVAEISQLIALTVVSRFLTSLVHYDTQTEGHQIDSSIGEDKINSEAEKDEENDGKVIKNPMLHEYQTMLRYGSNEMLISDGDNHIGCQKLNDTNIISGNFLTGLIAEISIDMVSALIILGVFNASEKTFSNKHFEKIGISRINRIFQVLCLLEAACFREPENQTLITSSVINVGGGSRIKTDSSTSNETHIESPDHSIPFPRLILCFLSALFPIVANKLQCEKRTIEPLSTSNINPQYNDIDYENNNNKCDNNNNYNNHNDGNNNNDTYNQNCEKDFDRNGIVINNSVHTAETTDKNKVKITPTQVLSDFEKLRNLFPELPADFIDRFVHVYLFLYLNMCISVIYIYIYVYIYI